MNIEVLQLAYEVALANARLNPTVENRAAAISASANLSSATVPPKVRGTSCRAGKRQAAERRALVGSP